MNSPQKKELVVCKVTKIMPYGVIVHLEEYNLEGFVPLSQVAPRWIKNIRNFVKIGQIKVGKVTYVNEEKNQIDISFASVSDIEEKQKMNEYRLTKRVQQLLEILAKKINKNPDTIWDQIVNPILEKYNSVYDAFKDIVMYGKDYVEEIPKDLREPLYEILKKNIIIKEKEIKEQIALETKDPKGIQIIKDILNNIPKDENIKTELTYMGNGKFLFSAKALEYKKIEKYLNKVNEYLEKSKKKLDKLEIKRLK